MKRLIFSLIGLLMLGSSIMVYGSTAPDSVIYYYGFEDNLDSFSEENPQDSIEGIWYCDDDLNKVYFKDTIIRVSNDIGRNLLFGWSEYSLENEIIEKHQISNTNSTSSENSVLKWSMSVEGSIGIDLYGFSLEPNQLYRVSFWAKSIGVTPLTVDIRRGYHTKLGLPKNSTVDTPTSGHIGFSNGYRSYGNDVYDFELTEEWKQISLLFYYTGDSIINNYVQNMRNFGYYFKGEDYDVGPYIDESGNKFEKTLQADLFSLVFYSSSYQSSQEIYLDDITIERTDIPVANALLDKNNNVILDMGYDVEIEHLKGNSEDESITNQWSLYGTANNDSFVLSPSKVEKNSYVTSYCLYLDDEISGKSIDALTLHYESNKTNREFALKITDEYFSGLISEDNYVPDFVIPITYGYNNGQATDVPEIDSDKTKEQSVYYDLFGRRVENPQSGLYIKDGKKIFIKY